MDQQSIESLLRRLVQRVEESERRYNEALEELHTRLDRLSQRTGEARSAGAGEEAETFDRLHDQVSSLARRLERDSQSSLDDFERLGRALSGELEQAGYGVEDKSDLLGSLAAAPAPAAESPFDLATTAYRSPSPETDYSFGSSVPPFHDSERDLDKRLVEMAHRLERSIDMAMPAQALEALNARLDEIGSQIAQALEQAPKGQDLAAVEGKIADLAQQLGRAEAQFAKIGEIEGALNRLIERMDAEPKRLEDLACKAAEEAARRITSEMKLDAGTTDRLDAMHRDLMAVNDRTRASDDRLAATIEAVHDSLKKLVQLVETVPAASAAKPRLPFAERVRQLDPVPPVAGARGTPEEAANNGGNAPAKDRALKNRLGAGIPDFQEGEPAPSFGRAKRIQAEEKPFDLDTEDPGRALTKTDGDASYDTPDDLVAAARRAAQAAALKAEERAGGSRLRRLPGDAETFSGAEFPSRRKRSFLIIFAAILLAISAALLYGRLRSKPDSEIAPPAAEQSIPQPSAPSEGSLAPEGKDEAPAAAEPKAETPPSSSSPSEVNRGTGANPTGDTIGEAGQPGNFTEIAKSAYRPASTGSGMVQAQPASLKPVEAPSLPPGVVFSIEDPTQAAQSATGVPLPMPQSLPLPPADLGPLALRQAAAEGDPRAQYAIALRYAEGQGTAQNFSEALRWLERAASAGLAPAQYRLGAMYERGQGVTKDLGRARSWYQAAAEKGNVKAMHNLAVNLSGRESGSPDYALAAKWYGEAAAHGLADSQFNLGILAEHGLGMPKNLAEAYKWFALAAASGDAEAAKRSDRIKAMLDAGTRAEADKALASWSAKQALAEANEVMELAEWAELSAAPNASLVSRAQGLLNRLGYNAGTPDGLMGARTREAIKNFERKNGQEETGKVTVPLVAKLERLAS